MLVGLIINPVAGVGGRVGLKGSDGQDVQEHAFNLGATKEAVTKASIALEQVLDLSDEIHFLAVSGEMGGNLLQEMGFTSSIIYDTTNKHTTPEDTMQAVRTMLERGIELLVFAGGDGTARDVYNALDKSIPVVGIPAGVKIHSAVYANSLSAAGKVLRECVVNKDIRTTIADVMDIDEILFRQGSVVAKKYGELRIPQYKNLMQHPKAASANKPEDLAGIFHELTDRINAEPQETKYIWGTGGTILQIMSLMKLEGSLLGADVSNNIGLILKDGTEKELLKIVNKYEVKLILSVIGGQGHILGRGNMQISPEVIRKIGVDNIWIISTVDKILGLDRHVLHVDTIDREINDKIAGYRPVIVGWQKEMICKVES